MRLDRTDITLIVDRSGSMEQMRTDAEGGVNAFVRRQVAEPGEAVVTLVQFDTEYEFLHKGVPAAAVGEYTLVPRGGRLYSMRSDARSTKPAHAWQRSPKRSGRGSSCSSS